MPPRKNKRKSMPKSSDVGGQCNPNDTAFFEALMSDPEKKKLVLQLLSQEKDTIAQYKRNAEPSKQVGGTTPLKRVKQKAVCESPTALMRRRALEKQLNDCRSSPLVSESCSVRSKSRESLTRSSSPSPVPFQNLLNGVIAYVEIRSKDTDRSAGAKALMISMGATIRDTFTTDVTHVVFKDGSFTTYQKAKLMKVHMVSVLWLEAVRRSLTRPPEKNYPALGTEMFDNNISSICSQLQKEYEEVVREDVRRSLAMGTPLPSTKSLLSSNRRRTIMTPFSGSQFCVEKFRLSQELPSSQDREVVSILSDKQKMLRTIFENTTTPSHDSSILASPSPEITSDDDSNCGVVDGDYSVHKRQSDTVIFETPECIIKAPECIIKAPECVNNVNTMRAVENLPQSKISETCTSVTDMVVTPIHRKTDNSVASSNSKSLIGGLRKSNNMELTVNISACSKRESLLTNKENNISSDKSTNISDDKLQKSCNSKQVSIDASKDSSGTDMSKLRISSDSSLSRNIIAAKGSGSRETRNSSSTNMSLHISSNLQNEPDAAIKKGVDSNDSGTNKSCLRVMLCSSDLSKRTGSKACNEEKGTYIDEDSANTKMSSSCMSSSHSPNKKTKSNSEQKRTEKQRRSSKSSSGTSMSNLRITNDASEENLTDKNLSMSKVDLSKRSGSKATSKEKRTFVDQDSTDTNVSLLHPPNKKTSKSNSEQKRIGKQRSSNKSSTGSSMSNLQITDDASEKNPTDTNLVRSKLEQPCNIISSLSISVEKDDINQDIDSHKNVDKKSISETNSQFNLNRSFDVQNDNAIQFDDNVTIRARRRLFPRQGNCQPSAEGDIESNLSKKNLKVAEITSTNSSDVSSSDRSQNKRKRLRKLYNPDRSIEIDAQQCDEEERNLKRKHVKKKPANDFLDPNVVQLVPIVLLPKGKINQVRKTASINISTSSDENSPPKKAKKKTKTKKSDKKPLRYSSVDEQKELASEFATKKKMVDTSHKVNDDSYMKVKNKNKDFDNCKTPTRNNCVKNPEPCSTGSRKSVRLSQRPNCTPLPVISFQNRRSTLEFQPFTPMSSSKKKKLNPKLPSIVCTKFHKDDCMVFTQIVRKLGGFLVEDEVSDRTTHLVAGEAKRTINMLRAIARGCWILKHEWLLGSLEQGRWLPEEDYEVTEFSPAVQQCRLQRQAFGPAYSMDIFEECHPIYIARSSIPRCSDLQELVGLCKGTVTTILRNARIVVGEYVVSPDVVCVTETWILDSITYNRKKPFKKYLIKDPHG